MNRGLFVTGTDTGVGKTFVLCVLGAMLKRKGIDFGVFKPIQTGAARGGNPDLDAYRRCFALPDPEEEIVPVRLKAPQAPTIAAAMEKREVFIEKISRSFYILQHKHKNMLVEGIGGVMVPLVSDYLVLDFIKMTGLSALIVAASRLGTINHSSLTVLALKQKGIKVAGVVLNKAGASGSGLHQRVCREIERISGSPVLGSLGVFGSGKNRVDSILASAGKSLNTAAIMRFFEK